MNVYKCTIVGIGGLSMDLPTVEEVLNKIEEDIGTPVPPLRGCSATPAALQRSYPMRGYSREHLGEKEAGWTT